jgi:hypothetical protein
MSVSLPSQLMEYMVWRLDESTNTGWVKKNTANLNNKGVSFFSHPVQGVSKKRNLGIS